MQKFEARNIPINIWREIVEFCQQEKLVTFSPKSIQMCVAQELGYEIEEIDAALASIRF
jgi:hypothetical protein|tara:strand:+ start:6473 stop:6649 length:177 start_codon:yes stop_codon:yes gene_type:complete